MSNDEVRQLEQSASPNARRPLLVADVGNSAVKIGRVVPATGYSAGYSIEVLGQIPSARLAEHSWSGELPSEPVNWRVVSVARPVLEQLQDWVFNLRPYDSWVAFDYRALPLKIAVEHPERVGLDRLAAAVGANVLRQPDEAMIVIDAGTAITVDVVDREGTFQGGLILPGPRIAARALAVNTAQLPDVQFDPADVPALIGKNTVEAIRGGIYWGVLGALEFLIRNLRSTLGEPTQVLLTGGAMELWSSRLSVAARYVPELVLMGVAEAAALPPPSDGAVVRPAAEN